jgi:hypothetical protein
MDLPSIIRIIALSFFLLLFILGVFFAIWQQRSWKPPLTRRDKLRRSIIVGFGAYLAGLSFMFLLDIISTSGHMNISNSEVLTFHCIALPVFVVASIGSYIGFLSQDRIYSEGKKRVEKGKEE